MYYKDFDMPLDAFLDLANFFREADWLMWLALMVPYSIFFFLVDAHATWRAIRWFNAPDIKLTNILPIRASAYILSLFNEQVGKGAMSLYLMRRYDVPGWKAVSTMIMLGLVEIYQLLVFSAIGVAIYFELVQEAAVALPLPEIMLSIFALAFLYFPFHLAYFRSYIFKGSSLREKSFLHALRQAEFKHYILILLCKAPNLLVQWSSTRLHLVFSASMSVSGRCLPSCLLSFLQRHYHCLFMPVLCCFGLSCFLSFPKLALSRW